MTSGSENQRENPDAAAGRGDRLRRVRELLGLSQAEMGDLAGVSERSWQDYERGITIPKIPVYEKLSGQGFSAEWLLWGEGDPKQPLHAGNQGSLDSPPVIEARGEEAVDELMRVLSHPAAVRAYQRGGVTIQSVMAAAMQHAIESEWSAEQLARLATLSNILGEVLRDTDERIGARASHP